MQPFLTAGRNFHITLLGVGYTYVLVSAKLCLAEIDFKMKKHLRSLIVSIRNAFFLRKHELKSLQHTCSSHTPIYALCSLLSAHCFLHQL